MRAKHYGKHRPRAFPELPPYITIHFDDRQPSPRLVMLIAYKKKRYFYKAINRDTYKDAYKDATEALIKHKILSREEVMKYVPPSYKTLLKRLNITEELVVTYKLKRGTVVRW